MPEPLQVFLHEQQDPVVQPERFPYPVADEVTAVEDGNLGFVARQKLVVDGYEHGAIAHVVDGDVRAAHRRCRVSRQR